MEDQNNLLSNIPFLNENKSKIKSKFDDESDEDFKPLKVIKKKKFVDDNTTSERKASSKKFKDLFSDYQDEFSSIQENETKTITTKKPEKRMKKIFNGLRKEDYEKYLLNENNPTLEDFNSLVLKIKSVNSSLKKIEFIKSNPQCAKFWKYISHPYYHYGFEADILKRDYPKHNYTSISTIVNQNGERVHYPFNNFFQLLDLLRTRKITGDNAKIFLFNFISENEKYKSLIMDIVDKNLTIGIGEKRIISVFDDLIPEFNVALGVDFNKPTTQKPDFETEQWFVSRKYDGICVLIFFEPNHDIEFHSRSGKTIETLAVLENKLKPVKSIFDGYVLHGECCCVDLNGNENFQLIQKDINRKNYTISKPKFLIFDIIKLEDFWSSNSHDSFSERQELLKQKMKQVDTIIKSEEKFNQYFEIVKQEHVSNNQIFNKWQDLAKDTNWEGLILRKANVGYNGKRSNDIIKIKKYEEDEFECIKIDKGMISILNEETKLMEQKTVLTNIYVKLEGNNLCSIGSGFSHSDRIYFSLHPEEIIGKKITIKHYGRIKNNTTKNVSLRLPIFKCVRKDL